MTIRDVNNQLLAENDRYTCSYISCAALAHPLVDESGEQLALEKDETTMKNKWKSILRLAAFHNHKNIVLGALGSGAFRVPPAHMSQLLYELLVNDPEFNQSFEHVFIAILDPYLNTKNFQVYSQTFSTKKIDEPSQENTQTEKHTLQSMYPNEKHTLQSMCPNEIKEQSSNTTDIKEPLSDDRPTLSKSQRRRRRKAKFAITEF